MEGFVGRAQSFAACPRGMTTVVHCRRTGWVAAPRRRDVHSVVVNIHPTPLNNYHKAPLHLLIGQHDVFHSSSTPLSPFTDYAMFNAKCSRLFNFNSSIDNGAFSHPMRLFHFVCDSQNWSTDYLRVLRMADIVSIAFHSNHCFRAP